MFDDYCFLSFHNMKPIQPNTLVYFGDEKKKTTENSVEFTVSKKKKSVFFTLTVCSPKVISFILNPIK